MMKIVSIDGCLKSESFDDTLQKIDVLQSSSPFVVSCYLNLEAGKKSCIEFLRSTSIHSGSPYLDLDLTAINRLLREFEGILDDERYKQASSLAIFSRLVPDRETIVVPVALPLDNHLSIYSQANILPLQNLNSLYREMNLLLYINKTLQVYKLNLGNQIHKAWAYAPHIQQMATHPGEKPTNIRVDRHLRSACLSLLKSSDTPILMCAQPGSIEGLSAWLPKNIRWHISGNIELPENLKSSEIMGFISATLGDLYQAESDSTSMRLLNSIKTKGPATVGALNTVHALRTNQAECLVVEKNYSGISGKICEHCATFRSGTALNKPCQTCGETRYRCWNSMTEATWIAHHLKIPTYVVDSDELNYMGGMGCLLQKGIIEHRLPLPRRTNIQPIHLAA